MKRTDMAYEEIVWHTEDHNFVIGLDRLGEGPTVLLLPALSSISTRHEMRPLQLIGPGLAYCQSQPLTGARKFIWRF